MPQPPRTARVGEQIRTTIAELLTSSVRDPGIGFITITRVAVTPDLQQARVFYTTMGDDKERGQTQRGLERARPMLRRAIGQRLRLKRVPELLFMFDHSIERQDRLEQILQQLEQERTERESAPEPSTTEPGTAEPGTAEPGTAEPRATTERGGPTQSEDRRTDDSTGDD